MNTVSQREIEDLAQRYSISSQAVTVLLKAVQAGNGSMAQFSHPELGGLGQWSQGGMTMIGDMFNDALKVKVDRLCSELASLSGKESSAARRGSTPQPTQSQSGAGDPGEVSLFVPTKGASSNDWWGADLGSVAASGSQNHIRYAYFPGTQRLAIKIGADVTIYDAADHEISGVSQQQSGDASLTFISQHGLVRVADLRVVSGTD
jgi:hypothetical protein